MILIMICIQVHFQSGPRCSIVLTSCQTHLAAVCWELDLLFLLHLIKVHVLIMLPIQCDGRHRFQDGLLNNKWSGFLCVFWLKTDHGLIVG